MSIIQTTRLKLHKWTSGADHPPTRLQMDADVDMLEAVVLMYSEGPDASLPASITGGGQLYYATDSKVVYFDFGTGWAVVGLAIKGTAVNSATVGQTANMEEWRDATNSVVAWIDSAGKFHGHFTDPNSWVSPAGVFQNGFINAPPYYYGTQYKVSGDRVQLRGAVQSATNGAGIEVLWLTTDTAVIPRDSQRFPVWVSSTSSFSATARIIGTNDYAGDTPGRIYLSNFPSGVALDINMTYLLGT